MAEMSEINMLEIARKVLRTEANAITGLIERLEQRFPGCR